MKPKLRYRRAAGGQRLVCRVVLFCLFRALRFLATRDSRVRAELSAWPEGWVLGLVIPGGPGLYLTMQQGRLTRIKATAAPDVLIQFKSLLDAFYVFTGQMGVSGAYAQHRFCLRGSVNQTMGFVRCVDIAEGYLFPAFWAKRILKALPGKQLSALRVYSAVLFGR